MVGGWSRPKGANVEEGIVCGGSGGSPMWKYGWEGRCCNGRGIRGLVVVGKLWRDNCLLCKKIVVFLHSENR